MTPKERDAWCDYVADQYESLVRELEAAREALRTIADLRHAPENTYYGDKGGPGAIARVFLSKDTPKD